MASAAVAEWSKVPLRGLGMKFAVGILLFLWLLSGLVGAWMLDDLDSAHWKKIARGPLTLKQALDENPTSAPGSL